MCKRVLCQQSRPRRRMKCRIVGEFKNNAQNINGKNNITNYWPFHEITLFQLRKNNKDTYQPAHPQSLVCTFVISAMENMMAKCVTCINTTSIF